MLESQRRDEKVALKILEQPTVSRSAKRRRPIDLSSSAYSHGSYSKSPDADVRQSHNGQSPVRLNLVDDHDYRLEQVFFSCNYNNSGTRNDPQQSRSSNTQFRSQISDVSHPGSQLSKSSINLTYKSIDNNRHGMYG